MLVDVDFFEVYEWYLVVYIDVYEWVEVFNVIGMSQFVDGGLLGLKFYVVSGVYIDCMLDYCFDCKYDVKQKIGLIVCFFNVFYWDFFVCYDVILCGNLWFGFVYCNWDCMDVDCQLVLCNSVGVFFVLF